MDLCYLSVSRLKPWAGNPRDNTDAVDAVARSIRAFGFNAPILCDRKLNVVAGHTRLAAAKRLKMQRVPVIILGISMPEARAYAIADNKTASLAKWDYPRLRHLLEDLGQDVDLSCLGFEDAEIRALLTEEKDFDWDAFDRELMERVSGEYKLVPVKVPMDVRDKVLQKIRQLADRRGISDKDTAIVAGKVLLGLLKIIL